jgi:hypothetical protein
LRRRLEHGGGPEHLPDAGGCGHEPEVEIRARTDAGRSELGLDRAEASEGLAERIDGGEPAEALASIHQALVPQELERLADGDAARLVGSRQLGFTGQVAPRGELTLADPATQVVGDRSVADLAHLSYTCI